MTQSTSPEKSPQALDVALSGGRIMRMMRMLFGSVIRASVLEAVSPMFADLREGQLRIEGRMDRIEGRMDRIEGMMERLDCRMNRIEERLDRLDERMDRLDARMDRLVARVEATLFSSKV